MEKELYLSTNPASGPNSTTKTEPLVKLIALVAHCWQGTSRMPSGAAKSSSRWPLFLPSARSALPSHLMW